MKKVLCFLLGTVLCAGLLAGCGTELESDTSIVYVDNKGKVISLDVESFERDYYDASELETFVNEAVDAYTQENGKDAVKVDELTIEDGVARLKIEYATTADYASFNEVELYQGKVVRALAEGYDFDAEFARIDNGIVTGAATLQDIYAEDDLKVVIIKANTDVKVDGEICYVSCRNVKLSGSDTVSIRDGYYLQTGASDTVVANRVSGVENASDTESVFDTESVSDTESILDTESVFDTEEAVNIEDSYSENMASVSNSFETDVYTYIIYK